jgi:hypothetical protein
MSCLSAALCERRQAYNNTFLEWQIYKEEKNYCLDSGGCGALIKGEGWCETDDCKKTIPGPKTVTENGATTTEFTEIFGEILPCF